MSFEFLCVNGLRMNVMVASVSEGSSTVPVSSFIELCFQVNTSTESSYLSLCIMGQTSIKGPQHPRKKEECDRKAESVVRNSPDSEITVDSVLGGSWTQWWIPLLSDITWIITNNCSMGLDYHTYIIVLFLHINKAEFLNRISQSS